jgi:hypothetical protein
MCLMIFLMRFVWVFDKKFGGFCLNQRYIKEPREKVSGTVYIYLFIIMFLYGFLIMFLVGFFFG